jgi:hypothetical protein
MLSNRYTCIVLSSFVRRNSYKCETALLRGDFASDEGGEVGAQLAEPVDQVGGYSGVDTRVLTVVEATSVLVAAPIGLVSPFVRILDP